MKASSVAFIIKHSNYGMRIISKMTGISIIRLMILRSNHYSKIKLTEAIRLSKALNLPLSDFL